MHCRLPAALDCVCRLLTEAPVSLPLLIGAAFLLLADLCVLDAPIALQLCRRFDVCFTLGNARAGWSTSSAQSSAPTANSAGRCVWRPTRCVARRYSSTGVAGVRLRVVVAAVGGAACGAASQQHH